MFIMRLYLDCYSCILRQSLHACRIAGADEDVQKKMIGKTLDILQVADPASTPVKLVTHIQSLIRAETNCSDPYQKLKRGSTQLALSLYDGLKSLIENSDDPFDTAVRVSIAGNIIDFGAGETFDLHSNIQETLKKDYAINHVADLKAQISKSGSILYIADNAGETVFDRLLIETIGAPVQYVVRGGPALNDATYKDALEAGIDQVADIMSSGSQSPGIVFGLCSEEFLEKYHHADVVIAKGQGNFESLSDEDRSIFFLLQTKCEIIARDVGVPVHSIVAKWSLKGE